MMFKKILLALGLLFSLTVSANNHNQLFMPFGENNASVVGLTFQDCQLEGVGKHHPLRAYMRTPDLMAEGKQVEGCWTITQHPTDPAAYVVRVYFTDENVYSFELNKFQTEYPNRSIHYDPTKPEIHI